MHKNQTIENKGLKKYRDRKQKGNKEVCNEDKYD